MCRKPIASACRWAIFTIPWTRGFPTEEDRLVALTLGALVTSLPGILLYPRPDTRARANSTRSNLQIFAG